jgi:hypothetical protein
MFKLEEKPKKGSQNQPISEIGESSQTSQVQTSQVSPVPDKSNGSGKFKESKKSEDTRGGASINKNPQRRFRDFLTRGNIDPDNSSPSSANDSSKSFKESSKSFKEKYQEDNEKSDKSSSEAHDFHLSQELMKFNFYRKLQSNKEQVIRISGGIIGAIFIIAGILYLLGSGVRVADNVVYGERAVISAFLILVGVLIIAGIFARRFLEGSFLKNIHSELEVAEDPDSEEIPKDMKEKQKDNIGEKDKK